MGKKENSKLEELVRKELGVALGFVKKMLEEYRDKQIAMEELVNNETYNRGVVDGMELANKELAKMFKSMASGQISDFRDIDPKSNVEDIVVTDSTGNDEIDKELGSK